MARAALKQRLGELQEKLGESASVHEQELSDLTNRIENLPRAKNASEETDQIRNAIVRLEGQSSGSQDVGSNPFTSEYFEKAEREAGIEEAHIAIRQGKDPAAALEKFSATDRREVWEQLSEEERQNTIANLSDAQQRELDRVLGGDEQTVIPPMVKNETVLENATAKLSRPKTDIQKLRDATSDAISARFGRKPGVRVPKTKGSVWYDEKNQAVHVVGGHGGEIRIQEGESYNFGSKKEGENWKKLVSLKDRTWSDDVSDRDKAAARRTFRATVPRELATKEEQAIPAHVQPDEGVTDAQIQAELERARHRAQELGIDTSNLSSAKPAIETGKREEETKKVSNITRSSLSKTVRMRRLFRKTADRVKKEKAQPWVSTSRGRGAWVKEPKKEPTQSDSADAKKDKGSMAMAVRKGGVDSVTAESTQKYNMIARGHYDIQHPEFRFRIMRNGKEEIIIIPPGIFDKDEVEKNKNDKTELLEMVYREQERQEGLKAAAKKGLDGSPPPTEKKEEIPLNKLAYGFVPGVDLFKRRIANWFGKRPETEMQKWVDGGKTIENQDERGYKEGMERYRAAVRARLEARKRGTIMSEAEHLGLSKTLHKFAEDWKKHKWKRIAISIGLTGLGLVGTTGAVAMSPFVLGGIASAGLAMRVIGGSITGLAVYNTMYAYFDRQNYAPWRSRLYAGLCAALAGGTVASGSYLLQHLGVTDAVMDSLGFSPTDVTPTPAGEGATTLTDISPTGKDDAISAVSPEDSETSDGVSDVAAGPEGVSHEISYDTDSTIASKGIDGLIDEQLVSNGGALESYNLPPEALEQFKDAARRVFVDHPEWAQALQQTDVDVIANNDVVFSDDGTINMRVWGDPRFLAALENTITKQEVAHLVPALGGEDRVHDLIDDLKQRYA